MASIKLDEKITLRAVITPVGSPVEGGRIDWTATPANLVSLFPVSDGSVCVVAALAKGAASIVAKGDVDLTAGVTEISDTDLITIVAADTATLKIVEGAIEKQ